MSTKKLVIFVFCQHFHCIEPEIGKNELPIDYLNKMITNSNFRDKTDQQTTKWLEFHSSKVDNCYTERKKDPPNGPNWKQKIDYRNMRSINLDVANYKIIRGILG